jgi:hypothetical protein
MPANTIEEEILLDNAAMGYQSFTSFTRTSTVYLLGYGESQIADVCNLEVDDY